jgi:hypothetical protein
MARKKHSPEQIVAMLRQIEIEVANHKPTGQACREPSNTELPVARPICRLPVQDLTSAR